MKRRSIERQHSAPPADPRYPWHAPASSRKQANVEASSRRVREPPFSPICGRTTAEASRRIPQRSLIVMRRVAAQCAALVAVVIVAAAALMPTPPPAEASGVSRWSGLPAPDAADQARYQSATTPTGRRLTSTGKPRPRRRRHGQQLSRHGRLCGVPSVALPGRWAAATPVDRGLRHGLRRSVRAAAGRGLVPVLLGLGRPARGRPVACGLAARDRSAAVGGPGPGAHHPQRAAVTASRPGPRDG